MKKKGNLIIFEYLSQTDDSKFFPEKENITIKVNHPALSDGACR